MEGEDTAKVGEVDVPELEAESVSVVSRKQVTADDDTSAPVSVGAGVKTGAISKEGGDMSKEGDVSGDMSSDGSVSGDGSRNSRRSAGHSSSGGSTHQGSSYRSGDNSGSEQSREISHDVSCDDSVPKPRRGQSVSDGEPDHGRDDIGAHADAGVEDSTHDMSVEESVHVAPPQSTGDRMDHGSVSLSSSDEDEDPISINAPPPLRDCKSFTQYQKKYRRYYKSNPPDVVIQDTAETVAATGTEQCKYNMI